MLGNWRETLLGAVSALAAEPACAAPVDVIEHWGRFVAAHSEMVTPHDIETVEIDRAAERIPGYPAAVGREVWLLVRTTVTVSSNGQQSRTQWADSRACPSLIPTLATLADIEPVSIQPPGRPFPQGRDLDAATAARMRRGSDPGDRMSFDTGTYTIEAQGHWAAAHWVGKVSMTGDGLSPASAWVNGALQALALCWSTTDPTR